MLNTETDILLFMVSQFIFVITRILIIILIIPIFGDTVVNKNIKVILSIVISILIIPTIPCLHIFIFSKYGVIVFINQIFIAVFIGLLIKLVFFFVILSGEILSAQLGLSFAICNDLQSNNNISIFSKFLNIFLFLIFLHFYGIIWIIYVIKKSFIIFPINSINLHINHFSHILNMMNMIFVSGIMVILPIIFILFIFNILMGILNRLSIYLSIFSIGFSMLIFFGIIILFLSHSILFKSLQCSLDKILNIIFIIT